MPCFLLISKRLSTQTINNIYSEYYESIIQMSADKIYTKKAKKGVSIGNQNVPANSFFW